MAGIQKIKSTGVPSFAFVGGFGSGKSYFSRSMKDMLEREFGITVYKVSIAARLKDIVRELYGDAASKDRDTLQWFALETRKKDPNVWPERLVSEIKRDGKTPFVIDDIRFLNDEAIFRREFPDLVIVRIETSKADRINAYEKLYGNKPTAEQLSNPTESEITKITADVTIRNDYDPHTAAAQLNDLIGRVKNARLLRKSP